MLSVDRTSELEAAPVLKGSSRLESVAIPTTTPLGLRKNRSTEAESIGTPVGGFSRRLETAGFFLPVPHSIQRLMSGKAAGTGGMSGSTDGVMCVR